MKIIVGLGNPGEKYENTRHNLGFMVLDSLLEKYQRADKTFWETDKKLKAQTKQVKLDDATLLLVKPQTFMNDSGIAVQKVLSFYKVDPQDMTVIHDELDLPFGKQRIRFGGGAGGHHGVESIIEHVGDKFLRIRLGIGTDNENETRREHTDKYVLGNITSHEKGKTKTMINEAIKSLNLILEHGIDTYMAKYNK